MCFLQFFSREFILCELFTIRKGGFALPCKARVAAAQESRNRDREEWTFTYTTIGSMLKSSNSIAQQRKEEVNKVGEIERVFINFTFIHMSGGRMVSLCRLPSLRIYAPFERLVSLA